MYLVYYRHPLEIYRNLRRSNNPYKVIALYCLCFIFGNFFNWLLYLISLLYLSLFLALKGDSDTFYFYTFRCRFLGDSEKQRNNYRYRLKEREKATPFAIAIVERAITIEKKIKQRSYTKMKQRRITPRKSIAMLEELIIQMCSAIIIHTLFKQILTFQG